MSSEMATVGAGAFDANDAQVAQYLGLDPRRPADRAAVKVAQHYGLDPVLKHVIVIPKGGVYITRDGLLHIAHRSGQFDGMVVEREPEMVDGEWVARVSVYRKDMRFPFTYPGRYPQSGSNRQYAQEMALKAAESHALRRAFDITGMSAYDEMREAAPEAPASLGFGTATVTPADEPEPVEAVVVESDPLAGDDQLASIKAEVKRRSISAAAAKAMLERVTGRDDARTDNLTVAEADAVLGEFVEHGEPDATAETARAAVQDALAGTEAE